MKCNNCGYKVDKNDKFCQNCGNDILKKKDKESKTQALISLLLSLIPVIVIAYAAHVDSGCVGGCVGGLFVGMYMFLAGIPVGIVSIILGISSYKLKKNILAIIGIMLGVLQVLAIVFLLN